MTTGELQLLAIVASTVASVIALGIAWQARSDADRRATEDRWIQVERAATDARRGFARWRLDLLLEIGALVGKDTFEPGDSPDMIRLQSLLLAYPGELPALRALVLEQATVYEAALRLGGSPFDARLDGYRGSPQRNLALQDVRLAMVTASAELLDPDTP